jgi:putative SbcD/Mre11-related phosphoesterase
MRLTADLEIVDGLPVMHIRSLGALACADLHLGYEGVMASRGGFIPKINLKRIKETLGIAARKTGARSIIVDGDIKNEFSEVHAEEFNEFRELMHFLKEELRMKGLFLVKGNHDNFVDRLRQALGFELYRQEAEIGDYVFFHGEELPESKAKKTFVMGHLHPAIAVYNKVGVKEKLPCFLSGKMSDGREIVVLPAMNSFAGGVEVNRDDPSDIAPVFSKMLDVNGMRAYCFGEGETYDFGKVGQLRHV